MLEAGRSGKGGQESQNVAYYGVRKLWLTILFVSVLAF